MKSILFLFILSFALQLPVSAVAAESDGAGSSNIDVGLVVNGRKVADTWIELSDGGALIEIPATPVILALSKLVDQALLNRLESQLTPKVTFTNRILSRSGIAMSFNLTTRQVVLQVPERLITKPDSAQPSRVAKPEANTGPWTTPPVTSFPAKKADSEDAWKPVPSESAERGSNPGTASDTLPGKTKSKAQPAGTAQAGPRMEFQSFQYDQTRDELFEDVFKHKPPPLPLNVEVTLLVDGKSYGTLWLMYDKEHKRYTFPVEPVLNALQGLIRADLYEKLVLRANAQTRFTVEDLIESGFPTVLNTSVFELSTGVPAQLLGTRALSLTPNRVDPGTVPVVEAAPLSAYVNTRVRQRVSYYQYNPTPYDSSGFGFNSVTTRNEVPRQPATADFDGAINHKGWVLEGRGTLRELTETSEIEFSRQDIRLVHDWPKRSLRFTAGDLIFPTSGFQSFLKLGGVGLSRDFSLQPHLVAYPVKDFEFFLANPSEVKVYINGNLTGTYRLDPGPHDLTGFPATTGENEVVLRITDYTGQTQTLNFNFIHEASLLAKGISSFSFNVGLPSLNTYSLARLENESDAQQILNYTYDTRHPAAFLDYKRGLTDQLTLEAYSQALDTAGIIGVNSLQALKIGEIQAEVAGSFQANRSLDWAADLEYIYIPKIGSQVTPASWRLKTEYLGKRFYRQGQDPGLLGSVTFAGSFQKTLDIASLNLGLSYSLRPDSTDFYNAYASVRKSWKQGLSADLSLKNVFNRLRQTNTSISLNLNYFLFKDQHTVTASERVENHRPVPEEKLPAPDWDYATDLMWDYNGSAPFPQNPSLKAETSFGPSSNDYLGSAEWKGNQGIAGILAHRSEPKTFSVINNYADLTLETSLIYVDGNFALSRPINNSFVLVKGIDNEEHNKILVNPSEMGYDAEATDWFPGVVPYISSYYLKKFHMEVQNPPLGSDEDRTDYTIYPGYKSGYALYMGSKASIIALGTLRLGSGAPAVYQTFTATALEGAHRDPVSGFTNGAGKFQLTRLQAGNYKIETDVDGKGYSTILTLPKGAEGITSVGTLVLAPGN